MLEMHAPIQKIRNGRWRKTCKGPAAPGRDAAPDWSAESVMLGRLRGRWREIALFSGALFINLLAGFFLLSRHLLLKDTGEKLAHIEKQLRGRKSISEELSRRIEEQE